MTTTKPASRAKVAHRLDRLADAVNHAAALLDGGPCFTADDVERLATMRYALDRLRGSDVVEAAPVLVTA